METQAASEALLHTAKSMFEAAAAAKQVPIQPDNFTKFSGFLEAAAVSLQTMSISEVQNPSSITEALENLKTTIESANRLSSDCIHGNKIQLFLRCKGIAEDLESITKNISRAMNIFASESKEDLAKLCKEMLDAKYGVSESEEEILQRVEKGIEDRNNDQFYASDLLVSISQIVRIPGEHNVLKSEFQRFKDLVDTMESRTEASRMERVILLLSNADIITTPKEKEKKYYTKRNSLGPKIQEPLPSFLCPITGDVMQDPVETSLGHTFEKTAILKWLKEGNDFCPMTKIPLTKSGLRSNKTLKQSIEEWKSRNIMITIASMKPKIQSNDEEQVLCSLNKLLEYCNTCGVHREWIVMEDYVPIITGILCEKNSDLRMAALEILCSLAKDGDGNKEKIANVNDSIAYIVRLLARKMEESVLAVQLLLELSTSTYVRSLIGETKGCILLLVTLANNYDAEASKYAQEVLDNLSFLDRNVIEMAKSKFFKPLLQQLSEGPLHVQIAMAEALADVELTDHNKLSLSEDGVLKPLMRMLNQTDTDAKSAAVRALEKLSGIAENGIHLIKGGVKTPLFELLFCYVPSLPTQLREQVAKLLMRLAESTTSPKAIKERISLLESEDDAYKLFSLIPYSGPEMQETLLLTFRALCGSLHGPSIRMNLREFGAVKILVQLCELEVLTAIRRNSVKLLYHLTQDGDHQTFSEHVNEKCITNLLKIIQTTLDSDEKEASSAMGIISNLPQCLQISQILYESGTLEVISECLTSSQDKEIIENASRALIRFTVSSNIEWQKKVAETGFIQVLVKLLSTGSSLTKRNISVSLKQFSESSSRLSLPVKRPGFLFLTCCAGESDEETCRVHGGVCGVESSFCLLEAGAVGPLVAVLGEGDEEACEGSLDAILTLVEGNQLQKGCKVVEEFGGVDAIIKMLGSNSDGTRIQEKGLGGLQRIFRLPEFKEKYGKTAQIPLVEITQRGSRDAKSMAAKILAQLNVLNDQSSFF